MLTFYLAFYLTYILTFYLEYLTYILTIYLIFFLAFCLTYVLAFYLAIFVAFYLTCVRVQSCSSTGSGAGGMEFGPRRAHSIRTLQYNSGPGVLAFGARDMGFGSRRAPQPPGLAVRFGSQGTARAEMRRRRRRSCTFVKIGPPLTGRCGKTKPVSACLSSLFLPNRPQ